MSKEGSDGWYEDERGTITHSPTINSQKDLDDKNMKGSFIDKSFVGIDGDNRNYDFKEDGTVGLRSKDERKESGTKVLSVDRIETIVNETISRTNLAPIVISAVAISQSDSPIPGPADILAIGALYVGFTNWLTSTKKVQTITLEFAKPKYGEEAEHKKGARPSTEAKHQKGQSRKGRDKGGEKGDKRRTRHK